jgi:hypothetical protein
VVAACRSVADGAAIDANNVALFVHRERRLPRHGLPEGYRCYIGFGVFNSAVAAIWRAVLMKGNAPYH